MGMCLPWWPGTPLTPVWLSGGPGTENARLRLDRPHSYTKTEVRFEASRLISRKIASVFLKFHHFSVTISLGSFSEKQRIHRIVGPWSNQSLCHLWIRAVKGGGSDGRWGRNLWNLFLCLGWVSPRDLTGLLLLHQKWLQLSGLNKQNNQKTQPNKTTTRWLFHSFSVSWPRSGLVVQVCFLLL